MKCVTAVLLLAATCLSVVCYELQLNEVHSDGKVSFQVFSPLKDRLIIALLSFTFRVSLTSASRRRAAVHREPRGKRQGSQ